MNAIPPVHSGSIGHMPTLQAATPAGVGSAPANRGVSSLSGMSNVAGEVAEMLQRVGGGAENNQMLEAIIALLILMALPQSSGGSQTVGQSGENLMRMLGGGSASAGDSMSISLHYEQTTVSMTSVSYQTALGYAAGESGGGQVDVTA